MVGILWVVLSKEKALGLNSRWVVVRRRDRFGFLVVTYGGQTQYRMERSVGDDCTPRNKRMIVVFTKFSSNEPQL
jgi:hypothetical protein